MMASSALPRPSVPGPSPGIKLEKNAGLIMGTNNSSIVSKRSVERLYYSQPHFFQYFVRKPQRRSPTINRGYWLRMKAIESVLKEFVQSPATKQRVVINLGCGYDPLPFQWLAREPDRDVRFVDVDYRELMITKASIVSETPALTALVKPKDGSNPDFVIESERYYGLGCDLRDLQSLDNALRSLRGVNEALILCIAEVSITYMDPRDANALIAWTRTLSDDVTFVLLEQFLPDGPDHPFARTMLRHFQRLHTPLRSIQKYPSLHTQSQRFYDAGWESVKFVNLWKLWSDPHFLSPSQRLQLDPVEPFDEWEEFALFAAHYFLLTARTKPDQREQLDGAEEEAKSDISERTADASEQAYDSYALEYVENPNLQVSRRNGALLELPNESGYDDAAVAHHGGMTSAGRASSSDVYRLLKFGVDMSHIPPLGIPARQCHTITRLKNGYSVLIGGRTSPSAAMQDCYLQTASGWEQIQDLPSPRFRHSAAQVLLSNLVPGILVFGGKLTSDQIQHDIILWDRATGWKTLQVFRSGPQPRFGASFVALGDDFGFLSGGMRADGVVLQDSWRWRLVFRNQHIIGITFAPCSLKTDTGAELYFGRFGASHHLTQERLLLIGGIASPGCIQHAYELLSMDVSKFSDPDEKSNLSLQVARIDLQRGHNVPRPMLVGNATLGCASTEILIVGGGAVCFSFGTYWNLGLYILYDSTASARLDWSLLESSKNLLSVQKPSPAVNGPQGSRNVVGRVSIEAEAEFLTLVKRSQPKIIEGLDFGPCRTLWTKEYLLRKVGSDRPVVIHEAPGKSMSFQQKDFAYVTKPFGIFLEEVHNGGHQYLRSISSSNPNKRVANLDMDFPQIAQDFRLPPELGLVAATYHSSPLRITGEVAMWLHVDTKANVLCQIEGSKRLILFPPADMVKLDFPPGSTTSNLEIFKGGDPDDILAIPDTRPTEVILRPGEMLFIPPLWAHTAAPLQKVSIAVNVFFSNLAKGYAAGKDVYGNRDLEAYENGRRHVETIARAFDGIPPDLAHAYLLRLADELKLRAKGYAPTE